MKKIHFLHIPKTAGQSVHNLLINNFSSISPLRLNSQLSEFGKESVSNFDVISGHIDWDLMLEGGDAEFTFTVLRKPIDRILSFYHYLRTEALKLSDEELNKAERIGMKNALTLTPDDYFCSEDPMFRRFINNHYDNFYTYFFAAKNYNGFQTLSEKYTKNEVLGKAIENMSSIDSIYDLGDLKKLHLDLKQRFSLSNIEEIKHMNKGDGMSSENRLDALINIGACEKAKKKIIEMCELDNIIYNFVKSVK